jgi:ecotropic viral integration site 5 protein
LESSDTSPTYSTSDFVRDALKIKITPLMLDNFASEWAEICRQQNSHQIELENMRKINSQLSAQVRRLEANLQQINTEHVALVKDMSCLFFCHGIGRKLIFLFVDIYSW